MQNDSDPNLSRVLIELLTVSIINYVQAPQGRTWLRADGKVPEYSVDVINQSIRVETCCLAYLAVTGYDALRQVAVVSART